MSRRAPRISVVVIVLNGERFLEEALASIAAQTTDDWETLVVDDGSTDESRSIMEAFATRDARFVVLAHEGGVNRGMSASRNLGVARSRGEYVTFLDHDDAMMPEKLAAQAAALDAHDDAGAVIGPNLRWHSWRGPDADDHVQELGVESGRVIAPPGPLPVFLARTPSTPQAGMIRHALFDRIGGYDESFRGMYEDQVFLAKMFLGAPVYVSAEIWQKYRQHDDSCVNRSHRDGSQLVARRRFLRWLRGYLDAHPGPAVPLRPVIDAQLARTRFARTRAWIRRLR